MSKGLHLTMFYIQFETICREREGKFYVLLTVHLDISA